MYENIISLLTGSFLTLLGVLSQYYITSKQKSKEELAEKKAIGYMFVSVLNDFSSFVNNSRNLEPCSLPWKNTFWENHQLNIAKYFPKEAATFAQITTVPFNINSSNSFYLSADFSAPDRYLNDIEKCRKSILDKLSKDK